MANKTQEAMIAKNGIFEPSLQTVKLSYDTDKGHREWPGRPSWLAVIIDMADHNVLRWSRILGIAASS